jgi:putative ABC transport system permease protein
MNTYPGYDRRNVLTFRVTLPESKYRQENQVREFYRQLVERLGALPGVEAAAATSNLPGQWDWTRVPYATEGQAPAAPGELRLAISQAVSPEAFRVLRIPLLQGRQLTAQDGPDSIRVVVLNAGLARRLWPGENPISKRVHFGSMESVAPWCTVVGVVGDIEPQPLDTVGPPTAYFPLAQVSERSLALAVRTAGDPMGLAVLARAQVQALDSDQPVYDVRSLEKIIDDDMSGVKASGNMMMAYAAIALILAGSGVFALMAYSVAQRRHEIGVRMTLGAQSADVLRLVVGQALKLTAAGLAIGIPAAWALTRALSSALLGVIQIDTPVFAGFTLLLALTAALAAYIPARWATKVDPIVALRYE